jgi:hypothetical protein
VDDDEYGAVGRMTGKRNRSTGSNPAPVPLCSPQIPHELMRPRAQVAMVKRKVLTT